MDNKAIKKLCVSIMKADTEGDVVKLLQKAGYWDERKNTDCRR